MPQMAPISWLLLFILFSITFIIFNMMNFFIFFYKSMKTSTFFKTQKSFSWKW